MIQMAYGIQFQKSELNHEHIPVVHVSTCKGYILFGCLSCIPHVPGKVDAYQYTLSI